MKSLLPFLSLTLLLSSCFSIKDYIKDSDYSYKGKFNKYKSFDFMADDNTDTSVGHSDIVKKAIKARLSSMGYEHKEKKPDLLITYRFFYNDLSFRVYDQPEFNTWVENNFVGTQLGKKENLASEALEEDLSSEDITEEVTFEPEEELEYFSKKQDMLEGMIYLTFYDAKRHNTVWNGYMSGVFQDNNLENERFLRASVGKILDDYKVLARGYKFVQ